MTFIKWSHDNLSFTRILQVCINKYLMSAYFVYFAKQKEDKVNKNFKKDMISLLITVRVQWKK